MATAFEIQTNVPLPADGRTGGRRYPLREMQVGDSFYSPDKASRGGIYTLAKREGFKVTVRNEGSGIRVWRTA